MVRPAADTGKSTKMTMASAAVAAVRHGKYLAAGTTRFPPFDVHFETDNFLALFSPRVPPGQFQQIAATIVRAIRENTSSQVFDGPCPIHCVPVIRAETAHDGERHAIHIMLPVKYDNELKDPRAFRQEFGRQVCEVLAQARDGRLDYGEPHPPFLGVRLAVARIASRLAR